MTKKRYHWDRALSKIKDYETCESYVDCEIANLLNEQQETIQHCKVLLKHIGDENKDLKQQNQRLIQDYNNLNEMHNEMLLLDTKVESDCNKLAEDKETIRVLSTKLDFHSRMHTKWRSECEHYYKLWSQMAYYIKDNKLSELDNKEWEALSRLSKEEYDDD